MLLFVAPAPATGATQAIIFRCGCFFFLTFPFFTVYSQESLGWSSPNFVTHSIATHIYKCKSESYGATPWNNTAAQNMKIFAKFCNYLQMQQGGQSSVNVDSCSIKINNKSLLLIIFPLNIYPTAYSNQYSSKKNPQ